MNRTQEIIVFILRALRRLGPEPTPDDTLFQAVNAALPHLHVTLTDFSEATRQAEQMGYIAGTTDDLLGTMWLLTIAGTTKSRFLG